METSGFFEAEWNEETASYDLEYLAEQFANYFSLFIGNGVFGSPTNQLKVSAGNGLTVKVSKGWCFINGYWYYNDSTKTLNVPPNSTSQLRTDSVRCRFSLVDRKIQTLYFNNDVDVVRDGSVYDLKIAEVIIPPSAAVVLDQNITDTRMNEDVCGFVTQLLEVQTTEDLFAQYDALFMEWFNGIKGRLSGDLATALQLQIDDLKTEVGDWLGMYTIPEGSNSFTVTDSRIKADSIIDMYYAEASKAIVQDAVVSYAQTTGKLTISFENALAYAVTISNVKVVNP